MPKEGRDRCGEGWEEGGRQNGGVKGFARSAIYQKHVTPMQEKSTMF